MSDPGGYDFTLQNLEDPPFAPSPVRNSALEAGADHTYQLSEAQQSPSQSQLPPPPLGSSTSRMASTPSLLSATKKSVKNASMRSPRSSPLSKRRVRDNLLSYQDMSMNQQHTSSPSPVAATDAASLPGPNCNNNSNCSARRPSGRRLLSLDSSAKAKSRDAQRVNDSMVYLDGPQVYTCAQCRTHLTSHDDIISKSFHGRHGRAYLFDQCVNVNMGPSDDRRLITGLHTVCDLFCRRCKTLVGWTYLKAYEASQKYKEGKYIIEKINLHMEESEYYDVAHPAGERTDRWRRRSMSWGDAAAAAATGAATGSTGVATAAVANAEDRATSMIYEYQPSSTASPR